MRYYRALGLILLLCPPLTAADKATETPPNSAPGQAPTPAEQKRTDLNILGKTDTDSGEARRNENVQFNLIDNNALKDLNLRLGTSATLFTEFQADRSYFGSEFGNKPTSPIHLMLARPISSLHGSLFESHLNSVFDARSFFTVGSLKPAHENNYGLSFTERLWRNAALSIDLSQNRIRGNVNGNVLVPKADERTPLVIDPAKRALIQRFLDGFPSELPNRTDVNERALNTNSPQRIDDDNASGRLDQVLTAKDTINARYAFLSQKVKAFELVAGQNPDTTTRAHTAQLTWNRAVSASTVTSATMVFDRVTSLLLPPANSPGPTIDFSNALAKLGPSSYIPIDRAQNQFRYGGALKQRRGKHNWYAGADVNRRQINGYESSSNRGNLYFRNDFGRDGITNFLLGVPSRFSGATGNIFRGYRQWEPSWYTGDSWRVTNSLTLTFGVRHEIVTTPAEVNHLDTVPYGCSCKNLAPRFGWAYRMPKKWGTFRAAYGMQYGEIFPVTFQQVRYNPPLNLKFEVQAPDLLLPFSQLNIPVDPNARVTYLAVSPHLRTPYSHLYNFMWEPLTLQHWKIQLGYVGSRSHQLLLMFYDNRAQPVAGVPLTTDTINDRRPDPRYFDYRRTVNGSHAYFDAARASLVMPRWHGVSIDASYWLSKAIDLGGSYTNTGAGDDGKQSQSQTETDVWKDVKGPSSFDQRHAFLLRAAYTTPKIVGSRLRRLAGQWELSSVGLWKTGTPFTVVTGSDAPGYGNVDGVTGDRPNLLDPSILGRTVAHPDTSLALLPRSAFAYIPLGQARGNLGYNTFRKDGVHNINAAISRSFAVGGERKLVLRAESVNLTNTPQFASPWPELASPAFGSITNTLNDGRAFRFLMRFQF